MHPFRAQPGNPSGDPSGPNADKLQYISGSVLTNQECAEMRYKELKDDLMIRDSFLDPLLDNLRDFYRANGTVEDLKEFKDKVPDRMRSFLDLPDTVHDSKLCMNHRRGGDSCAGDSGGPLVTKSYGDDGVTPGQNYQQIGLTSYGMECGNNSNYGVYARVTTVLKWIKESIGTDHNSCPRQ